MEIGFSYVVVYTHVHIVSMQVSYHTALTSLPSHSIMISFESGADIPKVNSAAQHLVAKSVLVYTVHVYGVQCTRTVYTESVVLHLISLLIVPTMP